MANIYIDPLMPVSKSRNWRHSHVSHLFTDAGPDGIKDLHAFAEKIGLKRCWFQSKLRKKGMPHYDINPDKRDLAIAMGAQEVTRKECSLHMREWRLFRSQ